MINSKTLYFYSGTAISQAITILTTFFVINHVSPSIFGNFSYFIAIGSIVGSLSTLKFELSIPISRDLSEAYNKINLTVFVSGVINTIITLLYSSFYGFTNVLDLALLLALSNAVSLNACIQQILLYRENHKYSGMFPLLTASLNYIFLVLVFHSESGLKLSYVFANIITTIVFFIIIRKQGFLFKIYRLSYYKTLFSIYNSYPKYVWPGTISTILLTYSHPVLLAFLFTKAEVGLFSFSLRILLLPTIVVGAVLSGLFRTKLSKLYYEGDYELIRVEVRTVLKWLCISCVILYSGLITGIYALKYFMDMSKWVGIEKVSVLLLLYSISQFFYQPLSSIALVFDRRKMLLQLNLIQLFITLLAYFFSFIFKLPFTSFLSLLSILLFLFTIYSCFCFVKIIERK